MGYESAVNVLRRPWVRVLASALAALAVAAFVAHWMLRHGALDRGEILRAWHESGILPFFLAAVTAVLQVACQAARLGVLARESAGINWIRAGRIFVFGQAANLFLPARAGDIGKVVALAASPSERASSRIAGAAAILVADKVVDTVSFFLMALAAVPSAPHALDALRPNRTTLLWAAVAMMIVVIALLLLPTAWRAKLQRVWGPF
ncbi:MAG TPA: lysylphosphatidylglycerol synthase domain-containing protein, partial [Polyangiaceae bacterium]